MLRFQLDENYYLTVERCIDSSEYVWTLRFGVDDNGAISDGYAATAREAEKAGRRAYYDHLEYVEGEAP